MRLAIEDPRLNVRIGGLPDGRTRLVMDYPTEPRYCNAVLDALSDLIRPAESSHGEQAASTDVRQAVVAV